MLLTKPRHKPRRDRAVSVLSVECPSCKVGIGEKCVSFSGGTSTMRHPSRRRMAVRLDNEMRGI